LWLNRLLLLRLLLIAALGYDRFAELALLLGLLSLLKLLLLQCLLLLLV
jgi:hypothetical protein